MQGRTRVLLSPSPSPSLSAWAWTVALVVGAMSWGAASAAGAATAPAADGAAPGGAILMTRQWSADGKVPTGTIWRTFQTWQTDVARSEKGELVRVDPLTQRAGITDKGARVRLTTNQPGWAYYTKIAKVELCTTEAVHGSPLPPADWQRGDFDDSGWASDPNPQLQLYGLVARLCLRGKFAVTDSAAAGELSLTVRYRGGAVVYLNGKEIGRGHLPAGPLKDDALAEDYPHEAYVDSEGYLIEQGIYRRGGDDRSPEILKASRIEHGLLQWNGSWKWRSVSCDNAGNGYFCNKDPLVVERYRSRCRKLEVKIPPSALRKGVNVLAIEIRRAAAWEGMFTSPCYCDGKKSRLAVNSAEAWWDRCELEDVKLLAAGPTGTAGAAGAVVPNVAPPAGTRVWNHPAAVELDPSYYGNPNEPLMPIRLRGLKNGTYSGQVVVGSTGAIRGLSAGATELKGPSGGVIPASAVQVTYPRIVDGFAGNRAKAPEQFAVYDPLETAPPKELAASPWNMGRSFPPVQPVWVTVKVPRDAPAGAYKGTLTLNVTGEDPTAVPLEIEVIGDWPLPNPAAFTTEVSLFECPDAVARLYQVQMWSPEHWALLEKVFEVMGQLGVKDVYIPLVAKTHLGNPASMVRWIKQADGSHQCDTSIAERYLDLAVKHLGKLPRVCLYASTRNQYDPPASRSKNEKDQPICSELDSAAGKELKDFLPPKWGSAESQAFWKPVIERLREVLAKRGLESSMMFGFCADGLGPAGGSADGMPNHFADLYAISPRTRWMVSTHVVAKSWQAGKKLRGPDFLGSHSWMFGFLFEVNWMDDHDTDMWKPTYGWRDRKGPPVELAASRSRSPTLYGDHCPNVTRCRVCPEAVLLSKKGGGDFTYQGFGTWGADFWGNEWNVFDAYGNVALSETTVCWLVGPGLTGPVPTCRTRMLQEGLQEAEMRIFVQNAVLDDDKRAKLGADLAQRCQDACQARTRAFTYMSYYRYSDGETDMPRLRVIPDLAAWEGEFVKLARLADEVDKAMKR